MGRGRATCFIGYLLYLVNRITLCNTSFTLLTEYQLPVPKGCIVVPNRANFEYTTALARATVFLKLYSSNYCTTYGKVASLLEGAGKR